LGQSNIRNIYRRGTAAAAEFLFVTITGKLPALAVPTGPSPCAATKKS
jgi:hypothetical protein